MAERLLLLPPTSKDATLSREILAEAGLEAYICKDLDELCREIPRGAGAVVLTDDALGRGDPAQLARALEQQPPWSDLPVILLSPLGPESSSAVWAMNAFSNVTVLDQPVRIMTLISALRTAVKARQRQYELRDRLEALRLSDRQKDEFLATLSHELRNPLAPISNAVHVLRLAGGDETARARVVETLERQVGTVIRLVDDLLELSRISHGVIELRKETVSVSQALRAAAEAMAPLMQTMEHDFLVEEPTETLLLHADSVRLTQVITNLLNNAARYTPRGGKVWLTARREGSEIAVVVRDTGVGIPPDMLSRVFDLFVQLEPGRDRSRQGLGLGLTLVKRLVEMHGGRVEARSAGAGQGSEFIVHLPAVADRRVAEQTRARRRPAGERRMKDERSLRILIVDDNEDSAESLATLLRLLGHDVRVAGDGPGALETAATFTPDVALLDIGLPGMDGHELGRRLRGIPGFEHGLMLALSGYGLDADRRRSRDAGFDGHLVKPLDVDVLRARLATHFAQPSPPAPTPERSTT
ncbi:MAG TPA: ATP-binding protein [Gemmatimonadales bacterium]|nr:ATP-binding protein [Gemmatimonadales bacterium]